MQENKFKGVIFDFNGTLFWDSEMHVEAWRDYSEKLRGYPFTDEEMRTHMFGRTNEAIIEYAIGKKPDAAIVEKCVLEKEGVYRRRCQKDKQNFKLAKGAESFLDFLVENNIPHTIATMSEKNNVDFFIEGFNLAKWFEIDKIVYDDGTIPGKPAPDIYEIAAKKLRLKPEECIVIEDAVSGIESANQAGIGKIIAIESMETRELYATIPAVSEIIGDFDDFNRDLLLQSEKVN